MHTLEDVSIVASSFPRPIATIVRTACWAFNVRSIKFEEDDRFLLDRLKEEDADLLFVYLDGTPDAHGVDLLRRVRDRDRSPNPFIPVIAISGHREQAYVMTCIEAGFHEFVGLPLSPRTLWRVINHSVFIGRPMVELDGYFGPCRRRRDDPHYAGPERRADAWTSERREQEARMDRMIGNGPPA